MPRVEKTVFISYRRDNYASWALAIYQELTHSGYDVFIDYEGIASGDFETVILENIAVRAHFLVLLTPSALERCGEPNDWFRREIEFAMKTKRNIVPLTLDRFDFDSPKVVEHLTGRLGELRRYNTLDVPSGFNYFDTAMERLRTQFLNVSLDAVLQPASPSAKQAATSQQKAAGAAPAVDQKELTAQDWFERGYESSDLDEQQRHYSKSIELNPNSAAYNNRGLARQEQGNLAAALIDYTKSIELDPNYAIAYCNRGFARQEQGNLDAALNDYNKSIKLNPNYAITYNNRGNAHQEQGHLEDALNDHNKAIELNPNFANAYNSRGQAHQEQGNLDAALIDYTKAIELDPNHANAHYNRGLLWEKKSNEAEAITDFQTYLELGGGLRDGDQADVESRIIRLTKKL